MGTMSAPTTGPAVSTAVTTAVARQVEPGREADFERWSEAGIALARTFPGFLGGGWVRTGAGSDTFHVLYRFDDADALAGWSGSAARSAWVRRGAGVATDAAIRRHTGIEGWFAPDAAAGDAAAPAPARWKQAVTIWLGFFPVNLLLSWLLLPRLDALDVVTRTFATSLLITPLMVYLVLPFVTARLAGWLNRPH